jgi:hypothetical protein
MAFETVFEIAFDWKTEYDEASILKLLNKLPIARKPIIVIAYNGNYKLAELIEVQYAPQEVAMFVIDPFIDDKLSGSIYTGYGSPIYSSVSNILKEFRELEVDECCLVIENALTEDDIIIINKLQPSYMFIITDLTAKCGGSAAFHYWMDACVINRPLTNICCYKGDLEFGDVNARTAYSKALSKSKYSMMDDNLSKIMDYSDFSAFVITKTTDDFWSFATSPSSKNKNKKKKPNNKNIIATLDDDIGFVTFEID